MQARVRDRGMLTDYERGSAVSGNLRAQTALNDHGEHRSFGQLRVVHVGGAVARESGRMMRGVRRELDQLAETDADDLAGRLGTRQAVQLGQGTHAGRMAAAARMPIPTRVALGAVARGGRSMSRWRQHRARQKALRRFGTLSDQTRIAAGAGRRGSARLRRRLAGRADAQLIASQAHSEVATGGYLDVERASARFGRATAGRVGVVGGRVAGKVAYQGVRAAGKASVAVARAATRAAQAAYAMVQSTVANLGAAVGGSMLPGIMAALMVVLLLATILPSWLAGGTHEQREEALSSVCVSSPYQLGPVKPHVEQAAAFLGTKFGVETVGGYRAGHSVDPAGHPAGLALDFMFPMTAEGKQRGQTAAEFIREHAAELGVKYIIWYQQIWSVGRAAEGWRPMADRGSATANHLDHIHLSFTETPGTGDMAQMLASACGEEAGTGTTGVGLPGSFPTLSGGWARPAPGRITSPYGMRRHPVTGVTKLHSGTDYGASCGTPIRSASDGTVASVTPNRAYGTLITVDHGGGVVTRYAHSYRADVTVRAGDRVRGGQQISRVGSAGYSTGCHLHFEVKINGHFVDPVPFLRQRGVS